MKVVGLDLSLTAIGVAGDFGTRVLTHKLPTHASEGQKCERLHALSSRIDIITRDADLVVIEGYSFASQHSHAHSLGELGGLVKVILWRRGIPFALPTPQQVKKYATGSGGAAKEAVLAAAVRIVSEINTTHEADAWWLRAMALAHYRNEASNKVRKEVLDRIAWPRLETKGAA